MNFKNITLISIILFISSCSNKKTKPNELSEEEKQEGYQLLFNGKNTDGWHLYNQGKIASAWIVTDSTLFCKPDTFAVEHGDLISDKVYKNFDLKFDWNITDAGNSGVFFNVQESPENPTTWTSGPEFQLLDHAHIPPTYLKDSTHWAGCLYGFKPQANSSIPKPSGFWNESRIIQENGKVQFWLNGILTAEETLTGENWQNMVAKSNFKTFPNYGKTIDGRIALQDWSKGVHFRNIKIKEL
jgi:Domain of Unknown Function (DUF1080)